MRRVLRRAVGWMAALALVSCAPVRLLNATVATGGLAITRDVAFGPGPRDRLDIYRPDQGAEKRPVVVFFYGGSWQFGSRGEYRFVAAALARRGLVVVVPDYRLYPEVRFPDFLADSARAVAWTVQNIPAYGGDTGNLFLVGHSAGAYNVAMLALDPHYLAAAGTSRDIIRGVVGLAGPYDFLPITGPTYRKIFATPDLAVTQPITFADGHAPPMLLLAGTDDDLVEPRNTSALAEKLRANGSPAEDKFYPGVGHIGIILSFARLFRSKAPALADTLAFINHETRPSPPSAG